MQISKADRIRSLLKQGYSTKVIADIVGCRDEYVRAVRQRTDEDGNPITGKACLAWQHANREKRRLRNKERYHTDPEYRARSLAASKRWHRQKRQQSVSA